MCHIKQDIEAGMNLSFVTKGNLKISRRKYNPESGQITFTLELTDPEWQPRLGRMKWNETLRTFKEVIQGSQNNFGK